MPARTEYEDDLDFMPEVEAAARRSGSRLAYVLSILTIVFFVAFIVWARYAVLDVVTRGEGRVIPSSRVQVIQNLEGGILSELLVREGDIVEKGAPLVRIDNQMTESAYKEARSQYLSLWANIVRLEAELEGEELSFPQEILAEATAAVADQRALYAARQEQLAMQAAVLRAQAQQRQQEIEEMRSRREQLVRGVGLAKEERDMAAPLVEKGLMPRLDLLRIEREISNLEGDLRTIKLSIPRAQAALQEANKRIQELALSFRAQALEQLNVHRAELKSLEEMIIAGKDRVTRAVVRSPVHGTIKEIKKNTIGSVIKPGEDILEIVPLGDTLVVEARIRPADIAFLQPGQPAVVKVTAYDFSIYGGLNAKLEEISADTITDERDNSFYRVRLRTEVNTLVKDGQELPIIPGMTATVEILTGKKSVLDYLLKPILKAKERALKER